MKSIKVFYNGEPLRNIYPHATKFQVFKYRITKFLRKLFLYTLTVSFLFGIIYTSFRAGSSFAPTVTYAEREVIKEIDSASPVMDRIAKCESSNQHSRNGQTLIKINTNGTYDQGVLQINSIWNKKATELGYNLAIEKDNRAFASYLYKNYGTEPWNSSKACWNK